RCWPSTSTLTVPSGSLSICRMVQMQPTSNMSDTAGSSLEAVFCATSMMRRSPSIASSSALMLLARPTNSGMTMCGNTTTSRKGSSGRSREEEDKGLGPDMEFLGNCAECGPLAAYFNPLTTPIYGHGPWGRRNWRPASGPSQFFRLRHAGQRSGLLGGFAVHEQRRLAVFNGGFVDHHLFHVVGIG